MNYGPLIFLGVFLTFTAAWVGLVFMPNAQLKDVQAAVVEGSANTNPRPYSGLEASGRRVYVAEGCVYCHSQQIRAGSYQADVERGWGPRRSDPRDYVHDYPVLLGTMRTGPDLTNIGSRQPSSAWHYLHLYDPQMVVPGSIMAPYPFLFEKRKISGQPTPDSLKFTGRYAVNAPEAGYEIVPTERARALVGYLKSLDHTYDLPPLEERK